MARTVTGRLRRMAVLPLGSFLPISSGKALVQTETKVVSNTRREQTGGEGEHLESRRQIQVKAKLGGGVGGGRMNEGDCGEKRKLCPDWQQTKA